MAGTIGLVQNDIKRVLAYSTVSQLGYMFLAMGVGAFAGGIFHLYTHAFFKALMFLGSGAVIHALHGEQDIRRMGGLKKELPITYWTFLIGALAIAGVPLLSGFFSKDEILYQTFSTGHTVLWVIGAVTSLLTAIYMFRLVFLTFHGERAAAGHGHDAHGHGAHGGARPRRPWPRRAPARRAAGDGLAAGHPGARLGRRRLRRRAARARRRQPDRRLPGVVVPSRRAEHAAASRTARPATRRARRSGGHGAGCRGARRPGGRARRRTDGADADGRVVGHRLPRHRHRRLLLPVQPRPRRLGRDAASPRSTGRS